MLQETRETEYTKDRGVAVHLGLAVIPVVAATLVVTVAWVYLAPWLDPVVSRNPLHGDAAGYHELALSLLAGHGYSTAA